MQNEIFLPIPGYEDRYRISNYGTVQSNLVFVGTGWEPGSEWRTMSNTQSKRGSRHHKICLTGKSFLVHRLVLIVFGPPKPFEGALALHQDDNPDNNHIDNLYWGTSKQNRADAIRSGKAFFAKGEENGMAILTEENVRYIRAYPKYHGYRVDLAAEFGVSVATIKDVISARSWAAVDCDELAPRTYGTGPDAGRNRNKSKEVVKNAI